MLMMMTDTLLSCVMLSLLLIFRLVVVVELPIPDLLAPDLSSCFLNMVKDLLEFVRFRSLDLIQG